MIFIFIGIISVVWAIFNIILFFKVWGMCNNVKLIATKTSDYASFRLSFYRLLLENKKKEAFELNQARLIEEMSDIYFVSLGYNGYNKEAEIAKVDEEIIPYYKRRASLTGYEMPEYLLSGEEFYNKMDELTGRKS